jgi:RNA polymerase sigma-70 factor (ECF subfamily)
MSEFSTWASEKKLLLQAKKGEVDAAKSLMHLLLKPGHALSWRILRNQADAEEAVQEAVFQLWRSAGQFEGNSSLKTYFNTIVMRECHFLIKRRHEHEDIDVVSETLDGVAPFQIDLRLHQDIVHQGLEKLTRKQRMALVLWAFHDMTATEIGQVMDLNKNAVDQLLWRAKAALREKLAER